MAHTTPTSPIPYRPLLPPDTEAVTPLYCILYISTIRINVSLEFESFYLVFGYSVYSLRLIYPYTFSV